MNTLTIDDSLRGHHLCLRRSLAHLDHRGSTLQVLKLKPLIARQGLDELPREVCWAGALLCQLRNGDGSAARSQKHVHAAARGIRESAALVCETHKLPSLELCVLALREVSQIVL